MPYIKYNRTVLLAESDIGATNPGDLNYQLTMICLEYLARNRTDYQHYNDVIGALECCKLEMYRRAIAPYEDTKIAENGDVFP